MNNDNHNHGMKMKCLSDSGMAVTIIVPNVMSFLSDGDVHMDIVYSEDDISDDKSDVYNGVSNESEEDIKYPRDGYGSEEDIQYPI